jgi:hypothetical protein
MELSLEDLQTRFRRHSITATLQCTGNRRNEFNETPRKVKGLEWDGGSISNAGGRVGGWGLWGGWVKRMGVWKADVWGGVPGRLPSS